MLLCNVHTVCPRSLDPLYVVSYFLRDFLDRQYLHYIYNLFLTKRTTKDNLYENLTVQEQITTWLWLSILFSLRQTGWGSDSSGVGHKDIGHLEPPLTLHIIPFRTNWLRTWQCWTHGQRTTWVLSRTKRPAAWCPVIPGLEIKIYFLLSQKSQIIGYFVVNNINI